MCSSGDPSDLRPPPWLGAGILILLAGAAGVVFFWLLMAWAWILEG